MISFTAVQLAPSTPKIETPKPELARLVTTKSYESPSVTLESQKKPSADSSPEHELLKDEDELELDVIPFSQPPSAKEVAVHQPPWLKE